MRDITHRQISVKRQGCSHLTGEMQTEIGRNYVASVTHDIIAYMERSEQERPAIKKIT